MTKNTLLIVNQEAVDEYANTLRGMTEAAVLREHEEHLKNFKNLIDGVFDEDGKVDLSKSKHLNGDNAERHKEVQELHGKLSATNQVLDEHKATRTAERRFDRTEDGEGYGAHVFDRGDTRPATPQGPFGQRGVISDALFAELAELGHSTIGEAAQRRTSITLDSAEIMNAAFTTSAGMDPFVPRRPDVVDSAQDYANALEVFPIVEVMTDAVKYLLETTYTDTAVVPKAEGTSAGEAALATTEQTVLIRRIPAILPVTDEALADNGGLARRYIDRRLPMMVRNVLEEQVLIGNGTGVNLAGISGMTNLNDETLGANTNWNTGKTLMDHMFSGMYKCFSVGKTTASNYILSPEAWKKVATAKDDDGQYYGGSPMGSPGSRIWGLPVNASFNLPAGAGAITGLVGDFSGYSFIAMRQGLMMEIGLNDDDFEKFMQSIRVSVRAALVVERQNAFTHFTSTAAVPN